MPGPCLSHRFISVEPNIRHTVGLVLSARPIQATLQVPEVAPPQAFHLVHRFPPTERLKSSGGAAAGEQSGSRRTAACQRLELPAPAGGPRGGDPGLYRRGRASRRSFGRRRCPVLPNGDWKGGEKGCSGICGWPDTGRSWRRGGAVAPNPPPSAASLDPKTPLSWPGNPAPRPLWEERCHSRENSPRLASA